MTCSCIPKTMADNFPALRGNLGSIVDQLLCSGGQTWPALYIYYGIRLKIIIHVCNLWHRYEVSSERSPPCSAIWPHVSICFTWSGNHCVDVSPHWLTDGFWFILQFGEIRGRTCIILEKYCILSWFGGARFTPGEGLQHGCGTSTPFSVVCWQGGGVM